MRGAEQKCTVSRMVWAMQNNKFLGTSGFTTSPEARKRRGPQDDKFLTVVPTLTDQELCFGSARKLKRLYRVYDGVSKIEMQAFPCVLGREL